MATRRNVKKRNMRKTIKQRGGMFTFLRTKKPIVVNTVDKTIADIQAADEEVKKAKENQEKAIKLTQEKETMRKLANDVLIKEANESLERNLVSLDVFSKSFKKNSGGGYTDQQYGDFTFSAKDIGERYGDVYFIINAHKTEYKDYIVMIYKRLIKSQE